MQPRRQTQTIEVPGARIFYETRGAGPVLLLIPGGPTDAGVFAALAACLADRYRVVAYDPRGNSRSTVDGEPREQRLDVHADDAARVLAAVGGEPAYVLGSSGGAQIGLELAVRHPARVLTLVAHEPPCLQLLPDREQAVAGLHEVVEVYRQGGVGPAMQRFGELAGLGGAPQETLEQRPPGPEELETFARIGGNMDEFLAHGLKPLSLYVPDVGALRAGRARVVVGVGATSTGQLAQRCALALAERLGSDPVIFPGDHGGFGAHAERFADTLHRVLQS